MVNANPQPLQLALVSQVNLMVITLISYQVNGGIASFVVRTRESSVKYQDCIFSACSTKTDNTCEMIQKCYITIPLRQGAFEWSG